MAFCCGTDRRLRLPFGIAGEIGSSTAEQADRPRDGFDVICRTSVKGGQQRIGRQTRLECRRRQIGGVEDVDVLMRRVSDRRTVAAIR